MRFFLEVKSLVEEDEWEEEDWDDEEDEDEW